MAFDPLQVMLQKFRANAKPFMADQVKEFRAMSAADQRELLFFMMANMALMQAAQSALKQLDAPETRPN